jgi:hypothetical protein
MSTRASLAASLGFAALFTSSAFAQAVIVAPDDFGPDDDVIVRDYIVRRPVGPGPIVGSIPLRPGSIVPADVELAPFTDAPNPRLRRFGYFVAPGDKIVVVDPATRAVVRILDR